MDAKTLNDCYARYKIEPELATEALYEAILEYARKIGRVHFESHYTRDEFRDACHDAGTDVFMELKRFRGVNRKREKCGFTSFATNCIMHDLMNWVEKDAKKDVITLDDPDNPVVAYDTALPLDTKMYYNQLLDKLSPEERALFALTAEGYSQERIGANKGVSHQAISKQWKKLEEKLRGWNDEKAPALRAKA